MIPATATTTTMKSYFFGKIAFHAFHFTFFFYHNLLKNLEILQ